MPAKKMTQEEAVKIADELYAKIDEMMGADKAIVTGDLEITDKLSGFVRRLLVAKGVTPAFRGRALCSDGS